MIEPEVIPLSKVDADGVPLLVQHVKYKYSSYLFELTFFDGRKVLCEPAQLLRYPPDFMEQHLSPEQWQDAYQVAQSKKGFALWGGLA